VLVKDTIFFFSVVTGPKKASAFAADTVDVSGFSLGLVSFLLTSK
jgi:hypothetical protein